MLNAACAVSAALPFSPAVDSLRQSPSPQPRRRRRRVPQGLHDTLAQCAASVDRDGPSAARREMVMRRVACIATPHAAPPHDGKGGVDIELEGSWMSGIWSKGGSRAALLKGAYLGLHATQDLLDWGLGKQLPCYSKGGTPQA